MSLSEKAKTLGDDLAYPTNEIDGVTYPGLTKREWLTGQAIKHIVPQPTVRTEAAYPSRAKVCARCAVMLADAALEALVEEQEQRSEGDAH